MSIVGKSQSGRACAEPASRPSDPRSGGGAKRRALTSVSTRARCWLDDAAVDHNILRSTRVRFLSVPDRDRFHSRVERDMPHGGGMVTLPVRDTRADDDPSSRGRPSHSSSRSHVQPLPCRFRARLPHYANDRRRSFAPLGLLLFRNRSEPTRVQFVGAQRRDHRQAASVQTAPDRWSWISAW